MKFKCKVCLVFLSVFVAVSSGSEVINYDFYKPQSAQYRISPTEKQGGFGYNGRPSLEYFDESFYAVWQANNENEVEASGRRLYLSTSKNLITWSKPTDFLVRSSINPMVPSVISGEKQGYPVLYNNKDKALWCFWSVDGLPSEMTNAGLYMSVLEAGSKLWYSTAIFRVVELGGDRYYAVPTQKPIRLMSSRLILPIRLCRGGKDSDREYSFPAFMFSDDDGKSWEIGGTASLPREPFVQLETAIHQQKRGQVRVFSLPEYRNNLSPSKRLLTTIATGTEMDDTLEFAPDLEFANMQTSSGNLATLKLSGNRYAMVVGDIFADVNGAGLCYNPAIFYSFTGENDFVGGYPFAAGNEISHAQMLEHDGKLFIIYAQNTGGEQRSYISLSWVELPDSDKHYILPRSKDVMSVYDVNLTRKKDNIFFNRIRAGRVDLPFQAKDDGRNSIILRGNTAAAIEVEPVNLGNDESIEIVLSMKINNLQDSGELTLLTIGDIFPVKLVMPSGRAGRFYVSAPGVYEKIAQKELGKWFMVKISYDKDKIKFSIDEEFSFETDSKLASQRFYIGNNLLNDISSTNQGSAFSVDTDTIITKTTRKQMLFEF